MEDRRRTLRIQATATRTTAVPGPFMRSTSTHGFFGFLTRGSRKVYHRAAARVFEAETMVERRDSPT